MGKWLASLRARRLAHQTGLLALAVVGLYLVVAPVAGLWGGWAGLWASAAAAGLCLAGAALALVVNHALREPRYALHGMLLGMAARMGIPLGLGLACQLHGGVLAKAGLLLYLLVFYPLTLGVETALSLPNSQQPATRSNTSQDVAS